MGRRGRKHRQSKKRNREQGQWAKNGDVTKVTTYAEVENQRKLVEVALNNALNQMQDRMPKAEDKVPPAFTPDARLGHGGPPALPYTQRKIGFDTTGEDSKPVVTVTVLEPPLFYYLMDIETGEGDKKKDVTLVAFDKALMVSLRDFYNIRQQAKEFRGTWDEAEKEGFKKSDVLDMRNNCCAQDVKSVVKHAMARIYPTTKIADGIIKEPVSAS